MVRRRGIVLLSLAVITGCAPPSASAPATNSTPAIEPVAEQVYEHVDADGVGWRIRDNVYESVEEALRVRPLPGWRLLAPGERGSLLTNNGVGLLHERHGIELYFWRPVVVYDLKQPDRERVDAWRAEATVPGPRLFAELDGVPVKFEAHSGSAEHLRAQLHVHGQVLEIFGRHPTGTSRELLRGLIREALAEIELLDQREHAELYRELDRSAPDRDLFGDGWSLRGDVYRNFDVGVSVRIPSRAMKVIAGTRAKQEYGAYELIFIDRGRARRGVLIAYEHAAGPPWHLPQHALELTGSRGIYDEGLLDLRGKGWEMAHWFVTRDGERVYVGIDIGPRHLLLMTAEGALEENWDDDLATLLTLEVDPHLQPSRTVAGRYFDVHAGFAIDTLLPVDAHTDSGEVTGFFFKRTAWTHGGESVEILAHNFEPSAGPIATYLRARMEVIEAHTPIRNPPDWVEITSPLPGRYVMWIDNELRHHGAALFVRGRTIYELNVDSRREQLFGQALDSFELLDD